MTFITQADTDFLLATPSATETGLLRALIYADVFNYPLTVAQLQRYLEAEVTSLEEVQELLASSVWLNEQISRVGEFYILKGREGLAECRLARAESSIRLWEAARWYAQVLACLPFVRMVAVTGALAMDNAQAGDDIDYLVVTTPGRVWLARACAIVLVRLARLVGVQLCPNYFLSTSAFEQERRDLFIAHELAQMTPLVGEDVYWEMRAANSWAADFLPNATGLPHPGADLSPGPFGRAIQRGLEWLLGGALANRLEHWEQERKTIRFQEQLHQPGSAARLDAQRIQGHFNDYGHKALLAYEERCQQYLGD